MSVTEVLHDRAARAAKNQSFFREITQRANELKDASSLVVPMGEWICECANEACVERVVMAADEYEAVRLVGSRFFVAPSDEHFCPDVERVLEHHDRYWIVQKTDEEDHLGTRVAARLPLSLST